MEMRLDLLDLYNVLKDIDCTHVPARQCSESVVGLPHHRGPSHVLSTPKRK